MNFYNKLFQRVWRMLILPITIDTIFLLMTIIVLIITFTYNDSRAIDIWTTLDMQKGFFGS